MTETCKINERKKPKFYNPQKFRAEKKPNDS